MKSIFGIELGDHGFYIWIENETLKSKYSDHKKEYQSSYYHQYTLYTESRIPKKTLINFFDHPITQLEIQSAFLRQFKLDVEILYPEEPERLPHRLYYFMLQKHERKELVTVKELDNIITMSALSQ